VNLPAQLFSSELLWLCNGLFAFILYRAATHAPWKEVLDNSAMVNAMIGLMFGAFAFWQINAGIRPGINFHVLGSTLFMLMFGSHVATIAIAVIMLASWLRTDAALITLGLNGLLMISLPVIFGDWLLRFSKRNMPKNLFLFVLWNGFACGAFSIVLNVTATSILLLTVTHYTWPQIQYHYLIPAPIIVLTEAFTTGMLITAFTVFQPQSVINFSDEEYINGK
jgi:uncharacterized membrane protein